MLRWVIAAVGALALALLTLRAPLPWVTSSDGGAEAAGGGAACDAIQKPANLDFALKDLSNNDVKLADFKGKVIVIDFWATWCIPCKMEIPGFIDLQTRYGSKGLQVIGISVDDRLSDLKPYVSDARMNYTVLQGLDHDDVQDAFGPMFGIPTTVVIGRDGRICKKHIGVPAPSPELIKQVFEREIKALL